MGAVDITGSRARSGPGMKLGGSMWKGGERHSTRDRGGPALLRGPAESGWR